MMDGACASRPTVDDASDADDVEAIPTRCGGDKIGALDLWVLKRMRQEKCAVKEQCKFGWEWEQGFRKGVADFYGAIGV